MCNKLYPIEQLIERTSVSTCVGDIGQGASEYANLGNSTTGQGHAKADALNHIQPTAVKEGEDVYFKTDDVLSKDNDHKTTAFIDAISKMVMNMLERSGDLKSVREPILFQERNLENASTNSIPNADIL